MLFFQVCHFQDIPELQMEQHTLVLKKILLNNHVLQPPSGKWLGSLYCTYIQW